MNPTVLKECKIHGLTDFRVSPKRPHGRCKKCAVDAVNKRRRMVKLQAIEYKGGKCEHCHGVFIPAVFDFHHTDPNEKDFNLASKGHCRSWDTVKSELDKCIMLCANCHRVEHSKGEEV